MLGDRGPSGAHKSRGRNALVYGILFAVAMMVAAISLAVFSSLYEMANVADRLDDNRVAETLAGALGEVEGRLSVATSDMASRDELTDRLRADDRTWIDGTLNATTIRRGSVDSIVIMPRQGKPYGAYRDGRNVETNDLVNTARLIIPPADTSFPADGRPFTSFIADSTGIAAFAVAPIRRSDGSRPGASYAPYFLVTFRHLDDGLLKHFSDLYRIHQLDMSEVDQPQSANLPVKNWAGKTVGHLVWTSSRPGQMSLMQVQPTIYVVIWLIGLFFALLVWTGIYSTRKLRSEEARARKDAHFDRLSSLLNRAGFFAELGLKVEVARKTKRNVLVIYLDLDGFKEVNDSYGHAVGDQLIRAVSAGLTVLVPEGALLARLGGDEFAVAVISENGEDEALKLAADMLEFFGEPFSLGKRVAIVGASIGIAVSPAGAIGSEEIIRRADMAMYKAKESGRGRACTYQIDMDNDRERRNELELALREAIAADEIDVVYQPVVDATTRKLRGVEALARWTRLGHGPVAPELFIDIAEKSGLIESLGLTLLRRACMQVRDWPGMRLSVNVSPGQFRNPNFPDEVADVLGMTGMEPGRLTLEVTENYFIQNPARARSVIGRLRRLGVEVALDDFGAGFSSIGYLRQFGFTRMKIDRSLIQALSTDSKARDMLEATIALARSLDVPVTAEGVEREDHAVILQLCGCDELQGYLFGRPADVREIEEKLGILHPEADPRLKISA